MPTILRRCAQAFLICIKFKPVSGLSFRLDQVL